jgi:hypothetical protein
MLVLYLYLYCPGGRQGNNQQNNNEKYTFFSGLFDGHWGASVRYYSKHHPMEEVQGFSRSHWMLPPGEHLLH